MRRLGFFMTALGLSAAALGGGKPLTSVANFDGKFRWVKLGDLPAATLRPFAHAKSVLIDVTFPRPVKLQKDRGGNLWFTFILADQGSDWKWHQTRGFGGVSVSGGVIRAGSYTVSLPLAGIPASVLGDKKQTISLGPSASGLAAPISFTVDRLRAR